MSVYVWALLPKPFSHPVQDRNEALILEYAQAIDGAMWWTSIPLRSGTTDTPVRVPNRAGVATSFRTATNPSYARKIPIYWSWSATSTFTPLNI